MRRFLGILILPALLAIAPTTASADGPQLPRGYYLSLGDSVAFGFQQGKFLSEVKSGTYAPSTFPGYTYRLAEKLGAHTTTVDFGCPGETTASYTQFCAFEAAGFALHDGYTGSQASAARNFLAAHTADAGLITVSLGANDLLGGVSISTIQANLTAIMAALRAEAPHALIVALEYYNPFAAVAPATNIVVEALDKAIHSAAAANGAFAADAFAIFNQAPPQPGRICRLTLYCTPLRDIHPSDAGYHMLSTAFWQATVHSGL